MSSEPCGAPLWRLSLATRRLLALAGALGLTTLVAVFLAPAYFRGPADPSTALAGVLLGFLCLFGHFNWVLWMVGFLGWQSRPRGSARPEDRVTTRTALVMPIYHEDTARVAAGIRRTWSSVREVGLGSDTDYFVLSDSTHSELREAEDRMIAELSREFPDSNESSGRITLVRRSESVNYKAGNIAHFLTRHGSEYDFMLVLDADSVMLGPAVRRLILELQRRPRTAVLQSLMSTFRGQTPFAQAMQFSISRLGPIFSCGFAWFLGPEALYWGHNALIRIAPFTRYAQLPLLPGHPPLGGRVLSQDVHEASLLGRAGWDVELDLVPGGSFEEIPSNVISYGKRDQRWCTGDFLNSALVLARGFRTGQRVWLGYAMASYAQSLLLLALMLLGFAISVRQPVAGFDGPSLLWALVYMPAIQFGSKILAFLKCFDGRLSALHQVTAFVADVLAGLVLTPLLVYQHLTFVTGILLGQPIQWISPSRDPRDAIDWRLAGRVFGVPTVIAGMWIPLAWAFAPMFLAFSLPLLLPWLLSIPIAVFSSRVNLGLWLARTGLFACPREPGDIHGLGSLVEGSSDAWWRDHRESTSRAEG